MVRRRALGVPIRTRRLDPRRFGRLAMARTSEPPAPPPALFGPGVRLFAMTFLAGFLFVSIILA